MSPFMAARVDPVQSWCRRLSAVLIAAIACMTAVATGAKAQPSRASPEAATVTRSNTASAKADRHMVVAANPLAVDAGLAMLRTGGSAVDAAIATQLVLNLVEPQSSGIGGGAFLVHFEGATRRITTIDGRETAPAAATPDRFRRPGGPRSFLQAVKSGLSVGAPGLVRALELAHRKHGRLPWARLFEPAITMAENGFAVSPRLSALLGGYGPTSFSDGARRQWFDDAGSARPAGHVLRNPEFAQTLRRIAAEGAEAFYTGSIAEAIVAAVRSAKPLAGDLTLEDLAAYRAAERSAHCTPYRGYRICGMGPPSSGATTIAQILGLIEAWDLGKSPSAAMNGGALHRMVEAMKLAYADRDRWIADPDFVAVPDGLTDPDYLAERRRAVDVDRASGKARAGSPPGRRADAGDDATIEASGTSHLSVVDSAGNVVAMTTTIESGFGSGLWAAGFLLNNQLTDFSFRHADGQGRAIANRVEGRKRPRSSMAPTIVLDADGRVVAAVGSPGGSRIINYVAQTLVALLDWRLDPARALALPHFGSRNGPVELELDPAALLPALLLKGYGHPLVIGEMNSGLHVIVRNGERWIGAADPRREGVARGD